MILALGAAFCIGVALEVSPLNGLGRFTSWTWLWRDLGILKTGGLLILPIAMIGWVSLRIDKKLAQTPLSLILVILALSCFLMQVLGMQADPHGLGLIGQIVASPTATSYFTDATKIEKPLEWLANFHTAGLSLHSSTHPPGPILFYFVFLKMFGAVKGAWIGGCVVGIIASAGVLVMYQFAGLWIPDRKTRLIISSFYAMLPATVLFFPEFDQVYPILSMLLILFWVRVLRVPRPSYLSAFYFGVTLFVATFFAYNLLTVGIFLISFAAYWLWRENWAQAALTTLVKASSIALATCVSLHAVIWFATGYHAISSFRHALSVQNASGINLKRHYLAFVVLDPYDFFLGAGIIALPILLFHLERSLKQISRDRFDIALTLIGLSTILMVDLSGLLRGEVTRVWIFLQPLLAVPVGLELSRYPRRWRLAVFAMQWAIIVCLKAKMTFLYP